MNQFVPKSQDGTPVDSSSSKSVKNKRDGDSANHHLPLCHSRVENNIAKVMLNYRKPLSHGCSQTDCPICLEILASRLRPLVCAEKPVRMVISAFPYKIPNERKTVSEMPDRSEYHALLSMANLCREIGEVYAPGANVVIGSDGLPFHHVDASFTSLSESQICSYVNALKTMIEQMGATQLIKIVSLDDYFDGSTDEMRQKLEARHATVSRDRVYQEYKDAAIYRGIKKAFSEDLADAKIIQAALAAGTLSNKGVKKLAGEHAIETIYFSMAWRNFLTRQFPGAIRLSIHPQCLHTTPFGEEKLGLRFGETPSVWFTQRVVELNETTDISPWQSVWVEDSITKEGCRMKRWVAEAIGARLEIVDGHPSHFVIES